MIKGHNIICFSSDWSQDPLSKHHIMSRLAKDNQVLWINSIGMRAPTLHKKDVFRLASKARSFMSGVHRVTDRLHVFSPLAIPFHGAKISNILNKSILVYQVKYCQCKLKLSDPILWTFLPNTLSVFGQLGEKFAIYYITDDFTQFTGHPANAIFEMEASLIERCDLVIASSTRLAQIKSRGKDIVTVTHGVNHSHFARALGLGPVDHPSDIKNIEHPIVGFFGEINDWLDLQMLAQAAKKRPNWSFVLLGRVAVEAGDIHFLSGLKNVHWLGQKRFSELPAYCAAFDVGLIPMKLSELTLSVNPLKLREYLAAGLPVVSSPLPEVISYKDVVKFATTADELIEAVEAYLKNDKRLRQHFLSQRVANESWDARVEEISSIIENRLARQRKP